MEKQIGVGHPYRFGYLWNDKNSNWQWASFGYIHSPKQGFLESSIIYAIANTMKAFLENRLRINHNLVQLKYFSQLDLPCLMFYNFQTLPCMIWKTSVGDCWICMMYNLMHMHESVYGRQEKELINTPLTSKLKLGRSSPSLREPIEMLIPIHHHHQRWDEDGRYSCSLRVSVAVKPSSRERCEQKTLSCVVGHWCVL